MKTIEEINQKIRDGDAVVVTAAEMTAIVAETGPEAAAREVDVVTTGTFGAMCSSGAFLNFGHSDPPIKMSKTYLNGVEAYSGLAAVDAYIGATQPNRDPEIGLSYGGSHVIEDLIRGKEIELVAEAYGTDCYPLKSVETLISLDTINQAVMVNPRNCYQNYAVAVNSTQETLYTYMGTLLPNYGNVTYSSAGELSPLLNDPYFQTIGVGTKIFLCGSEGYIIGEGTQHSTDVDRKNGVPVSAAGTLMVRGDMKEMDPQYVRGATMPRYGPTLYVGAGIPIPVLNEDIAAATGISDEEIVCRVIDYGVPRRSRPVIMETNYKELKSGKIEINGVEVPTSPLSSLKKATEIAVELKSWIEGGDFLLTEPLKPLPSRGHSTKPLEIRRPSIMVRELESKPVIITHEDDDLREVARKMVDNNINHIPVVDSQGILRGIVTSWDIADAVARGKKSLKDVMTRRVIVARENEPVDVVARRIDKYNISGLPIVDEENRVKGIITAEDISRLIGKLENRGESI
ncbi:homocysteine biosynthesis protein [Methanothermobacter marburgensis]|uniref:CBS domain containing protein n=1 Tax=Methanothermobacter marburgensis (strain ATCC BAA-927 / DSM 2133 / JCM 14651 / NBRC 100331 / OCM 82 / Marburg) TaxID=79929 RepID=D9PX92_METTM|nr:homocysteine biosynthesis protein [Methanothermobacter marburgensis]ADL58840.1 CBS domain containing protein [Methanothermobacter marburgensis str. Marburg]WBF09390.1 homocysteine biosynthesis protein [Methanothermobacter marburgensis]